MKNRDWINLGDPDWTDMGYIDSINIGNPD
jgi:hypothetical protein